MLRTKVETCVEALCNQGCREVRGYIARLEQDEPVPELLGLSAQERRLVLAELKSIMSVYGDACRI
ncbi:MAG: hypothetical protein G8D28_02580 [gamma proteobacterium symbiont of Phacoides pectinatus]